MVFLVFGRLLKLKEVGAAVVLDVLKLQFDGLRRAPLRLFGRSVVAAWLRLLHILDALLSYLGVECLEFLKFGYDLGHATAA